MGTILRPVQDRSRQACLGDDRRPASGRPSTRVENRQARSGGQSAGNNVRLMLVVPLFLSSETLFLAIHFFLSGSRRTCIEMEIYRPDNVHPVFCPDAHDTSPACPDMAGRIQLGAAWTVWIFKQDLVRCRGQCCLCPGSLVIIPYMDSIQIL